MWDACSPLFRPLRLVATCALLASLAGCDDGAPVAGDAALDRPDVSAPDVSAPDVSAPEVSAPDAALDVPADEGPRDVSFDVAFDAAPDAVACASTLRVEAAAAPGFFWVGQARETASVALRWEGAPCDGLSVVSDAPWLTGALAGTELRAELVGARVTGGVHRGHLQVRDATGRGLALVEVNLRALGSSRADATPKVLVIGIDGVRGDTMEGATLPNLRALLANAAWSYHASTQRTGPTSSGPGWTSIFTGVGPDRHGVVGNANYNRRDPAWPTFFSRAHDGLGLRTAVASQWADIVTGIVEPSAMDDRATGDGAAVSATMARWLREARHDVHFAHFDDVDHAGHGSGFRLTNPMYRGALEGVDGMVRPLLDAIVARPAIADERWLVVVCTDHGGEGTTHGPLNDANWDIPLFVAGPTVRPSLPSGFVSHMDVHPTVMRFLGVAAPASWRLESRALGVAYEAACDDGTDDDRDGLTDCDDRDCLAAPACGCASVDAGSRLGRAIAAGTTAGAAHRLTATCGRGASPERLVRWTAPRAGAFTFDTTGSGRDFDTVLSVLRGGCEGVQAACNDDASGPQSAVRVAVTAGERLTLLVEGKDAATGPWQLNAEAVDACPDRDLASATGPSVATGDVGDTGGTLFASCARSGRDVLLRWRAPSAGAWRFDTAGSGYDTVLHLRDGDCAGPELACADDVGAGDYTSQLTATLRAGQVVTVVVSGFNGRPEAAGALPAGGVGRWVLNINR
jgi:hypothetical protein